LGTNVSDEIGANTTDMISMIEVETSKKKENKTKAISKPQKVVVKKQTK
jgi:hypothetical protein